MEVDEQNPRLIRPKIKEKRVDRNVSTQNQLYHNNTHDGCDALPPVNQPTTIQLW